jgi:two-component system, LytTR family, sensor kinase
LYINIALEEDKKWISIINNLQLKPVMESGGGVGLANLSERYRLSGHDDIAIKKDDRTFTVSVKILTHAGNNN